MQRATVRRLGVDLSLVTLAAGTGVPRELADPNLATKLVAAPTWVYVGLHLIAAVALPARRRHPYGTALVIAGAAVLAPNSAVFLIPYAVTRYGARNARSWAVLATLVVAWLVGVHAWAIEDPFSGLALIAVSAVLGLYVRARRRLVDELVQRAERAERERDLLAERARAEERMRLAAEMHDVLTHRINLMVLQAGALQVTSDEPRVRQASQNLRETGVQALAELRDLVGVLRAGVPRQQPGTTPAPASDPPAVGELVTLSRAAGLAVELRERGDPAAAAPVVRRALYRVVQESLTNVHKHAPGATATVDVHYAPDRVAVEVHNTAATAGGDAALTGAGGGVGLAGLRRRVEMLGGLLTAGRCDDGGFSVTVRLPALVPADRRSVPAGEP
jgi:signal transduction histidine kinase